MCYVMFAELVHVLFSGVNIFGNVSCVSARIYFAILVTVALVKARLVLCAVLPLQIYRREHLRDFLLYFFNAPAAVLPSYLSRTRSNRPFPRQRKCRIL